MVDDLESISEQVGQHQQKKDPANPPLHLWHPDLSGDIDIVIKADSSWIHEGRPFERQALVRLFASILRREEDGEYYLVTPVEKWRLQVELLPLLVTDFDILGKPGAGQQVQITLNTGRQYLVNGDQPLYTPAHENQADVPAVKLPHGLAAIFTRAAYYRLVEACVSSDEGTGIYSCGEFYKVA